MAAVLRMQQRHKLIKDVRGRGLMIGMELATEEGDSSTLAFKMAMLCERKGLHVTFSYFEPVIRIIPPLIISSDEIDAAIEIMDEALWVLEKGAAKLSALFPENSRSGPFTKEMVAGSPLSFRRMW